MIESDTIKLLRECDAGVEMGVASIEDVLPRVTGVGLRRLLSECKTEHEQLGGEISVTLRSYHDEGKAAPKLVKGMSWVKTNAKMLADASDQTIADLMTDGCNMGVKSLSRYLNQYAAADEQSKNYAKRLIRQEEQLGVHLRDYL